MRTEKKLTAKQIANNLNGIIESRNLYNGHTRYVFAQAVKGVVYVENLQTGAQVPFIPNTDESGIPLAYSWRDGYGKAISTETGSFM